MKFIELIAPLYERFKAKSPQLFVRIQNIAGIFASIAASMLAANYLGEVELPQWQLITAYIVLGLSGGGWSTAKLTKKDPGQK